jgi:hypothetical protein
MKFIVASTTAFLSLVLCGGAFADTVEETKQKCNAEQELAIVATMLRDAGEAKKNQLAAAEGQKKSNAAKYKAYQSIIDEIYDHPEIGSWPYSFYRMWACYKDETRKSRKSLKQVAPMLVACQEKHGKTPNNLLDACIDAAAGWNAP